MRPTTSTKQLAVSPEGFTIEKEISTPVIPSQAAAVTALAGGFYGDPNRPETASPYLKRYLPEKKHQYTQLEIARAAFERENTAVATITDVISGRAMDYEEEPDFDPIDFVDQNVTEQTPELFPYQERLLEARSSKEGFAIIDKIKQEQRNDEILGNSGVSGIVWSWVAGGLDPINLFPVGGSAYKAIKAGKILKGAARTGAVGAGAVATSEGILQGIQETRTAEESAFNIAGGAILGGILGGSASLLSKRKFSKLAKNVEADIQNPSSEVFVEPKGTLSSAARADYDKIKTYYNDVYIPEKQALGETPLPFKQFRRDVTSLVRTPIGDLVSKLGEKPMKVLDKVNVLNKLNPIQRLMNDKYSVEVRVLAEKLIKNGMTTVKNELGIANAQSVEIAKKQNMAGFYHQYKPTVDKAYKTFKQRTSKGQVSEPDKLIKNSRDFRESLAKVLRNGDTSTIPELQEAAIAARKVLNHLGTEAQKVGLLSENLQIGKAKTALSYFPRLWSRNKIVADEKSLKQIISSALKQRVIPQIKATFAKKEENLIREISSLKADALQLRKTVEDVAESRLKKVGINSKEQAEKLIESYKNAKRNLAENKPKSLLQFLKENGGIVDYKGELSSFGITNKSHPGLLRKIGNGNSLDKAREKAIEAGYFPEFRDEYGNFDPSQGEINDLLSAIDKEVRGEKIFSEEDFGILDSIEMWQKAIDEIDSTVDINEIESILKQGKSVNQKKLSSVEKSMTKAEIAYREAKIKRLENKLTELQVEQRIKFEEVGDEAEYIDNITDDIVATLKGEERLGAINDLDIKITNRGPLKERTLDFVMDNEVEKFLENDADQVMRYYSDVMSTDIELARAFDGDVELSKTITQALKEYDEAIAAAKNPEEKIKINKEKLRAENDLTSLVKIMRGQYARPENPDSMLVRGGRIARQYNYITKMGMVTISSLADLVNTTAIHGAPRVFKTLPNLITNIKTIKLNINEAKLAGNITDVVMPERMASFSEAGNLLVSNKSSFETYLSNTEKAMSRINLMPQWNDFMKGFSSVVTQQRMTGAIKDLIGGKISSSDKTYLAFLGIGEQEAKGIVKMLDQFSYKEKNLLVANTEKWTDLEAKRIYRNALNTDVDRTIVSMGAGDIPLWMNTEMGKVIGQFKSFAFASTQQILIGRLQQKDLAALTGFAGAVAMGMFSFYLKRTIQGKELPDDPNVWLVEGIDRSGYLGIMSEFTNIANKVSRGSLSVGATPSRYASRNIAASLAGPSVSLIDDSATTIGALMTQDISEGDAKAMWRMIPFNNVAYFTALQEKFVESVANK